MHPFAQMKRLVPILLAAALVTGACGGTTEPEPTASATAVPTQTTDSAPVEEAADEEVPGVTVIPIGDVQHTNDPVTYTTSPPAGGNHDPGWQNCGFYTIVVPNEQAVHSLEHGAVWITYTDDASQADLDALAALAAANTHVLVTKYDGEQDTSLVATAWGRQIALTSATDPVLAQFMDTYMFDGPTIPEPGVTCASAYGIPPADFSTIG